MAQRSFHNIEKVAPWKKHYTGYAGGHVWKITKSNSSFGNWVARSQTDPNRVVFAFGLAKLSEKLELEK